MNHVLYVDKDESGTAFSKAEKRISDYFKGTVNVEVDKENFVVSYDNAALKERVYETDIDDHPFLFCGRASDSECSL